MVIDPAVLVEYTGIEEEEVAVSDRPNGRIARLAVLVLLQFAGQDRLPGGEAVFAVGVALGLLLAAGQRGFGTGGVGRPSARRGVLYRGDGPGLRSGSFRGA